MSRKPKMISGMPTAAGTSNFTVQVTGSGASTQSFSLTIDAAAATAPPAESGVGGGGCAMAGTKGDFKELAGTYGFLMLTALGMALRGRMKRRGK